MWLRLRLLYRPAQSLVAGARGKLGPKYTGRYQVLDRMGMVAYRLQLPEGACIHDMFHVGVLKLFRGTPPTSVLALPPLQDWRPL